MPRPLRLNSPNTLWHITDRGNGKQFIFFDDDDFMTFMETLVATINRYNFSLHAYALMTNHLHLLLETIEGNLSRGMQYLIGRYAQRFNSKHERVGHVFQGRFKSTPIENEAHRFEVLRYIVLNPVRAGLVSDPADWRWSNYSATAGLQPPPSWLNVTWTLHQFDLHDLKRAQLLYRDFVAAGRQLDEDPSRSTQPTLDDICAAFEQVLQVSRGQLERSRGGDVRALFAHIARNEAAASLLEIGAVLKLSESRVSRLLVDASSRIGAGNLRAQADALLMDIRSNKKAKTGSDPYLPNGTISTPV